MTLLTEARPRVPGPAPATPGTTSRRHLYRLHAGTFTGPTGLFPRRTELSKPQQDLLAKLDIAPPKQMLELAPTSR